MARHLRFAALGTVEKGLPPWCPYMLFHCCCSSRRYSHPCPEEGPWRAADLQRDRVLPASTDARDQRPAEGLQGAGGIAAKGFGRNGSGR